MQKYRVSITFTDVVLGSAPMSRSLYSDHILSKAPPVNVDFSDPAGAPEPRTAEAAALHQERMSERAKAAQEELAKLQAELEMIPEGPMTKGMTGFRRTPDGTPAIMDFQVKGAFKEWCGACRIQPGSLSGGIKAYDKHITQQVFIRPRVIPFHGVTPDKLEVLERPLRAQTMQGPRVALASSELLTAGVYLVFEVHVLTPQIFTREVLEEWLRHGGEYGGFGQWRSGGNGTFNFHITELNGNANGNGKA